MSREKYGSHTSVVLIRDNAGNVTVVNDPDWGEVVYKFAGGKSMPGESKEETAVREVAEETGVVLREDQLVYLNREDRPNNNHCHTCPQVRKGPCDHNDPGRHMFFSFEAVVEGSLLEMNKQGLLKKIGDEGEIVSIFSLLDIYMMATGRSSQKFLESHYLERRGGVEARLEELLAKMPQAI